MSMIKEEQKELAAYVKQVHLSLRSKSRQIGAEKAWEEHLENDKVLRQYAVTMKKLAEEYWSVNNQNNKNGFMCRIQWMTNCILEYFQEGGIQKELDKEKKKVELFIKKELIGNDEFIDIINSERTSQVHPPPYKLLDVGSCYNPFGKFDFLNVYPIDLYPASPEVKKCNFLETEIVDLNDNTNWFGDELHYIPLNFFDLVVFSLFLEYLPSPKQRYVSCVKAYECLKSNGLLLIATPDSKHPTANASLMKSWKLAAARIGFVRIKLDKLKYLHCMAFRKSFSIKYPLLLNGIFTENSDAEKVFMIPQDFVEYNLEEEILEESEKNDSDVSNVFSELPFS